MAVIILAIDRQEVRFLHPKIENEYMHEFGEYCDARIVKFIALSSFNNHFCIIGHLECPTRSDLEIHKVNVA